MIKYDAELRSAVYDEIYGVYLGFIYNDKKGRLRDGTRTHTSSVGPELDANNLIRTLNTTYKVSLADEDGK